MCKLNRALYGHPDSGGFWEKHCEKQLTQHCGFVTIDENWRSCFWHPDLKLYLVVYVDDFTMSGPVENMQKGWDLISSRISIGAPEAMSHFLGCRRVMFECNGASGVTYDMKDFLVTAIKHYLVELEKGGDGPKELFHMHTPYRSKSHRGK